MPKNIIYTCIFLILIACGSKSKKNQIGEINNNEANKIEKNIYTAEHFQIDLSITDFKHAMTKNGLFTFNKNGDYESVNKISNTIVIGSLPKMSEIERKYFMQSLIPKGENKIEQILNSEIETTKIGSYSTSIINSRIIYDEDDEGVVYWVILDNNKSNLAFFSQAYGNEKSELLEEFKETVKTVKLK